MFISEYDTHFKMLLNVLNESVNTPDSLTSYSHIERVCLQIIYTRIDCVICLVYLSQIITKNEAGLRKYKEYLKEEYEKARQFLSDGKDFHRVVFSSLKQIEEIFSEFDAIDKIHPLITYPE